MSDKAFEFPVVHKCDEHLSPWNHDAGPESIVNVDNLRIVLSEWARENEGTWFYGWALDGIIWGYFEGKNRSLVTSGDGVIQAAAASFAGVNRQIRLTAFRDETLLEGHIFGPDATLRLWRVDGGWSGSVIRSGHRSDDGRELQAYHEARLVVMGDTFEPLENGARGFILAGVGRDWRHLQALPYPQTAVRRREVWQAPRLIQRRYLTRDGRTIATRFIDLDWNYDARSA